MAGQHKTFLLSHFIPLLLSGRRSHEAEARERRTEKDAAPQSSSVMHAGNGGADPRGDDGMVRLKDLIEEATEELAQGLPVQVRPDCVLPVAAGGLFLQVIIIDLSRPAEQEQSSVCTLLRAISPLRANNRIISAT